MFSPYMKDILVWIGLVGCMTVDALVGNGCVDDKRRLFKIGKVALVDSHLAVHGIARWDEAVG